MPVSSRRVGPMYSWRGRPMRIPGSETISGQCATQPTVRAIANITVNIDPWSHLPMVVPKVCS